MIEGILKDAAKLPVDAKLVGVTSANSWVWLHPSANAGPVLMPSHANQAMTSMIRNGAATAGRYAPYVSVPIDTAQIVFEFSQGHPDKAIYNAVDAGVTMVAIDTLGFVGALSAVAYKKAGGTEALDDYLTFGALLCD
jgi:hypothetical protein